MRSLPIVGLIAGLALAGPVFAHGTQGAHDNGGKTAIIVQPPVVPGGKAEVTPADLGPLPGFGGPFALVDQDGVRRTERDFHGRFMLVMFGFTECIDVCPLELQAMTQAMELLGRDADRLAPVFITVDPQTDTPARLKAYLANFHPGIVGLTGTADQLNATLKVYRAQVARLNDFSNAAANQNKFGHTSFMYLMGPDGGFRSLFLVNPSGEDIAQRVRKYLVAS